MPEPKAICIEEMADDGGKSKFIRCVALPGRQPGLRLDGECRILWKSDEPVSCELWVSADEQLILYRPEEAKPSTVYRAGRSLDVPFSKPVVLIDGDEVILAGKRVRIHIHGDAPSVSAPSEFVPKPTVLDRVKKTAAAVVLGSVVAAAGAINVRCNPPDLAPTDRGKTGAGTQTSANKPIDVRDFPPEMAPPDDEGIVEPPSTGGTQKEGSGKKPPIDVRDQPPAPMPPDEPPPPPPGEGVK
ncbi:MAG: hypothetical protein ACYS8W_11360 [Planctomycetota bacterium]